MQPVNRIPALRGGTWIKIGFIAFWKKPMLWLTMAIIYLVIALFLGLLPFVGWLILVLFTPLLMVGALTTAQALANGSLPPDSIARPAQPAGLKSWGAYTREYFKRVAGRLFQGWLEEDKRLPIMVISTLLLGGVVMVKILAQLLKVGGAALPAMLSGSIGPAVWMTALLGLLIVVCVEALLLMAFLYTVPLITFQHEHPLPSIEKSFSAAFQNLGAFFIFSGSFALTGQIIHFIFLKLDFPFDYLAFILVGLLALPVFIAGLYASYQDLLANTPVSTTH